MPFESILEAMPDALVGVDHEGMIRFVNHQAELLFGYDRDDLVGQPLETLLPESVRQVHQGHLKEFVADPGTRAMGTGLDLRGRKRDGTEFFADISLSNIGTDKGRLVIAAVRDMSDSKEAEAAHRQSYWNAEAARSMIESSLDSLVTISPEGMITDVNEATVKVTGVPREELVGTAFSDYFTEPEKANEIYQRVFAEGMAVDYPLTMRHRDGRLTDVLYNAAVQRNAGGEVLGVFAAARDVTAQQKQAQTAIAQQAKELDRLAELERFQRLTVGRELKMIELKKEIDSLRRLVGKNGSEPDDPL